MVGKPMVGTEAWKGRTASSPARIVPPILACATANRWLIGLAGAYWRKLVSG